MPSSDPSALRVSVSLHALERLSERAGESMTHAEAARLIEGAIAEGCTSRNAPRWFTSGRERRRRGRDSQGGQRYAWLPERTHVFVLREVPGQLVCTTVLARPSGFIDRGINTTQEGLHA